jgi:hypothetical protein
MLINKDGIKKFIKENDLRQSIDFNTELDIKVKELVLKAIERAIKNKRTTILPRDL